MKGAGYLQQTCFLCARFARSWMRSPVSLAMQALQYMVAAALMGKQPCSLVLCRPYILM